MLALGAMAVVLGLSLSYGAPALAVSADTVAVSVSAADVAAAVARAEEAIAKTANATVNAKEVAAMWEYLQKWVAQAQTLDLERLTAGQLKELVAALDEGALGLRMKAGVDRKVVTDASSSATSSTSGSVSSATVSGAIAEPRTVKAESDAKVTEATAVASAAKTSAVSTGTTVKVEVAPEVAKTVVTDMSSLATLAVAQVKKPTAVLASAAGSASTDAEDTEVDVPKTGANDEEVQTSNAVRGMGLVLGGAVVLAAAGAVLIVKRMKRGL